MQGAIDAIKALSLGELFAGFAGLFEQKSFLEELTEVFASISEVVGMLGGLFDFLK